MLREGARPWLPDAVRLRAKRPLLAPPLAQIPDARVNALVQAGLRSPGLHRVPGLRLAAVRAPAERWRRLTQAERVALDPTVHVLFAPPPPPGRQGTAGGPRPRTPSRCRRPSPQDVAAQRKPRLVPGLARKREVKRRLGHAVAHRQGRNQRRVQVAAQARGQRHVGHSSLLGG